MGKNRVLHLSWLCGNKIFGKHHQEMSSYPDLLANQGVYVPFFLLGYVSHLEKGHGFNVEEQNLWLGVSPIYRLPVLRIRNCALNLYTCIPIGKDFVHVFSLRFHQIHSNPIYTLAKKNMSIPWKFHSTSKFHSHPKKKTSTNIVTHIHIITIINPSKIPWSTKFLAPHVLSPGTVAAALRSRRHQGHSDSESGAFREKTWCIYGIWWDLGWFNEV